MKKKYGAEKPLPKNRPRKRVGTGDVVRGLRAQIAELKRDARRVDWLQKNHAHELTLKLGWDQQANAVELVRWQKKYFRYHSFPGRNVRDAIDEAIRQDP